MRRNRSRTGSRPQSPATPSRVRRSANGNALRPASIPTPRAKSSPQRNPPMNLTPRQLDVIVAIRNFRHIHGYSPTMQELADQLGTSKVTIFEHVGALEKKRVLRRDKHKARSLEIVSEERLPDENRSTKLPLLGNIAAGAPIEAVENREELDLETMFH